MIEMRWVYRRGQPQQGWIHVDAALWQVLQYRYKEEDWGGHGETPDMRWTEWEDASFGGLVND